MGTFMQRSMNLKQGFNMIPTIVATASASALYSQRQPNNNLLASSNNESSSRIDFLMKRGTTPKISSTQEKIINEILQKYEYKRDINTEGPVLRFETNHYNANNPIEDRHCECYLINNDAYFFGMFDGHSGWHCSESLRVRLPRYLAVGLLTGKDRQNVDTTKNNLVEYLGNPQDGFLTLEYPDSFPSKQEEYKTGIKHFIENLNTETNDFSQEDLIKCSYLTLDRDISKEAIPDGKCNEPLWAGLSGAVTVGAYIKNRDLYIANTGDCRAVLGYKNSLGQWCSTPLSEDHTTDNRQEVKRLHADHPNEKRSVIMNQRLLGQLQPLRSFGDVIYKWSKELHRDVLDVMYGRPLVSESIYLTPPYLTAQPDVAHKLLDKNDRFIILATDGLWDTISNDLAVEIIGKYIDDLEKGKNVQENGATKLLRYSLGRHDDFRLSQMLSIPLHHRRSYHDDITITIVYFNPEYLEGIPLTNLRSKL